MESRRAFVVAFLCLFAGLGVSFAQPTPTLEEDYVARRPGWLPTGTYGDVSLLDQHKNWHAREANFNYSTVRGKEFLEFHREFLAQSDDFRIYGSDTETARDPDPVVLPVLAQSYLGLIAPDLSPARVKFGRSPSPESKSLCTRLDNHQIDDVVKHPSPTGECNPNKAFWTSRDKDGNLRLGTPQFHQYTANGLGLGIVPFHTNGHGAIGRHGPDDMTIPATSTRDPAFYQWHKNIDNIYADWAIGQYRMVKIGLLLGYGGMPIFFSVSADATGDSSDTVNNPNALHERRESNVYQGTANPVAPYTAPVGEYGAIPRIGSDIYVARDRPKGTTPGTSYRNLVYATGVRKWGTATDAWDIDAWSILNTPTATPSWYFSVTNSSVGAPGTAVDVEPDGQKGGDLFESCADPVIVKNGLFRQEVTLGLAVSDELDALEYDRERRVQGTNDGSSDQISDRPRQWFSLRSTTINGLQAKVSPAGPVRTVLPSDILRFDKDGVLLIDVEGATLGLAATDDLDALALVDVNGNRQLDVLPPNDLVYYSLVGGADILCYEMGVGPCAPVGAAALGLALGDDLDALDVRFDGCPVGLPAPPTGGPAPAALILVGACCGFSPGQACAENKTESECTTAGGAWAGEDSVCATAHCVGACCGFSPSEACAENKTESDCTGAGGTWAGEESVCATALCPSAPGACCANNGGCTEVSDQACYSSAGSFRGPGTTCPPSPACPVPPINDECANAIVIPYNYVSGFQPSSSDNTSATRPHFSLPLDPPYSCMDHNIFADDRGSGTIWYSYTVPIGSGAGPEPGTDMPVVRRSIVLSTSQAAQAYAVSGGAGDTRIAMYYALNGDCSALQEVACADNIAGDNTWSGYYAPLRYNNPIPGKYYIQVATVFDVDRGKTFLTVTDPAGPAFTFTSPPRIPAVTPWGIALMTLVLMGIGAMVIRWRC